MRDEAPTSPGSGELIDESVLLVDVEGVGRYTLMWTAPDGAARAEGYARGDGWLGEGERSGAVALAAGFAFGEGLFDRLDELESIARCHASPEVVRVTLAPRARARAAAGSRRAVREVRSSCGACGGDGVAHLLNGAAPIVASTMQSLTGMSRLAAAMQRRQVLWRKTGAAHAALLFSPAGRVLAFAEDLGRHNALDKAIGSCLLDGIELEGCGVVLSSRLSFEMVAKAARAGLAIVAGVSAASSLAVRTAHAHGITLCGFLREERMTVYTHKWRMAVDASARARDADPVSAL
ncbi:MAG: formate dehydrogenase accessory sulfurtransferase FdhD [Burkholderiaceae bacterium]|nr:formate dehydrogenase accessory sulfurtransferase FdhD [Burkholderiaceae bacterium]